MLWEIHNSNSDGSCHDPMILLLKKGALLCDYFNWEKSERMGVLR